MRFFSTRVIYSIKNIWSISILVILLYHKITVGIAQLVRALDCGSRGRGFEPHYSPKKGCIINKIGTVFFIYTSSEKNTSNKN